MCKINFTHCMHHVELTLRLAHMVYIQFYMIHKPCEIEYDIFIDNFWYIYSIVHDNNFTYFWLYMGKSKIQIFDLSCYSSNALKGRSNLRYAIVLPGWNRPGRLSLAWLKVPAVPVGVSLDWELTQGVIPDHCPLHWLALSGYLWFFFREEKLVAPLI